MAEQKNEKFDVSKIKDIVWLVVTVFSVFASVLIWIYSYSAKAESLEKKVDELSVTVKELQRCVNEIDKKLYYYEKRQGG